MTPLTVAAKPRSPPGDTGPPVITVTGGFYLTYNPRMSMPNPNRAMGLGFLALALIVVLYYIWPYLVGFLTVVGAAQIYCVCRNRRGRNE
jgi:hypothetical protein